MYNYCLTGIQSKDIPCSTNSIENFDLVEKENSLEDFYSSSLYNDNYYPTSIENFESTAGSGGVVMGVNAQTQIFYANKDITTKSNWTVIAGGLKYISYSYGQAFGVSALNELFYNSDYKTGNWVKVPGFLTQVSFDGVNMIIMGVAVNGDIYYANKDITTNPNWTKIAGNLANISYSNKQAYGVAINGIVCYNPDYTSGNWVIVPGALSSVSFDGYNMIVMGVGPLVVENVGGVVVYANKDITKNPNWTITKGILTSISYSNKQAYGSTLLGAIFYNPDYTSDKWVQIPGLLSQVSFDATPPPVKKSEAVVMGVNLQTHIVYANKDITTKPNWTQIAGGLKNISYSNEQAFGVSLANEIYYNSDYKTGNWVKVPGILKQVSFDGVNMIIMGVGINGDIYYANKDITTSPNWTKIAGNLAYISYSNKQAFGVAITGIVCYNPDYTSGNWVIVPGLLSSVSFDGYKMIVMGVGPLTVENVGGVVAYANKDITTKPNWVLTKGVLTSLSYSNYQAYGTTLLGAIYYNSDYTSDNWVQMPGLLSQVSFESTTPRVPPVEKPATSMTSVPSVTSIGTTPRETTVPSVTSAGTTPRQTTVPSTQQVQQPQPDQQQVQQTQPNQYVQQIQPNQQTVQQTQPPQSAQSQGTDNTNLMIGGGVAVFVFIIVLYFVFSGKSPQYDD